MLRVGGAPQIGAAGSSYGGGMSLLLAAADPRVQGGGGRHHLERPAARVLPELRRLRPGVFKKLWLGALFGNGFGDQRAGALAALGGSAAGGGTGSGGGSDSGSGSSGSGSGSSGSGGAVSGSASSALGSGSGGGRGAASARCGNFAPDVCAAYQASAATGTPNAGDAALMRAGQPGDLPCRPDPRADAAHARASRTRCSRSARPTPTPAGIAANGTPVRVVWRQGGHDNSGVGEGTATGAATAWFDATLHGKPVPRTQPFQFTEQAGVVSAATGDAAEQALQRHGLPGHRRHAARTRTVELQRPAQPIAAPAGGAPAVITSIPGLGGISARFDQALALLPSAPGQTAAFASPKLGSDAARRRRLHRAPDDHRAAVRRRRAVRRACATSAPTARRAALAARRARCG